MYILHHIYSTHYISTYWPAVDSLSSFIAAGIDPRAPLAKRRQGISQHQHRPLAPADALKGANGKRNRSSPSNGDTTHTQLYIDTYIDEKR